MNWNGDTLKVLQLILTVVLILGLFASVVINVTSRASKDEVSELRTDADVLKSRVDGCDNDVTEIKVLLRDMNKKIDRLLENQ
jgi:hypothetical protein